MPYCVFCDAELPADFKVMRNTLCPRCDAHLHVCLQCRFHEPTLHNQCLEPEAEPVRERDKANFCEFFALAGARAGGKSEPARSETRRAGSPPSEARASEARARLEALFKKRPADDDE